SRPGYPHPRRHQRRLTPRPSTPLSPHVGLFHCPERTPNAAPLLSRLQSAHHPLPHHPLQPRMHTMRMETHMTRPAPPCPACHAPTRRAYRPNHLSPGDVEPYEWCGSCEWVSDTITRSEERRAG